MELTIAVAGASRAEVARGVEAARAVFAKAGVTPMRAATARYNIEGWDIRGFAGELSPADAALCGIWEDAEDAALQACREGWDETRKSEPGYLELKDPMRACQERVSQAVRRTIAGLHWRNAPAG
jgi:hypothetical protein